MKKLLAFLVLLFTALVVSGCMVTTSHTHKKTGWQSNTEKHWKECVGCDEEFEKASHKFGEWEIVTDSTENTVGVKKKTCSVCEYVEEDEIPLKEPIDYGQMVIENLTLYTNFQNKPIVKFTKSEYAVDLTEITFYFDDNTLLYKDGYFEATVANKTITVLAETDHHSAEFVITTKDYLTACRDQNNANFYLGRTKDKEQKWINAGSPTNGTIFIGDSFFDTEFWSNFYETYAGNNAYTNGVSSSTTTDWEIWAGKLLYPMNPQNIVMHCGTNNLYDDRENSQTVISNTQRLLNTIHHHLPNAKIYYFAIEPREYGISGGIFDQTSYNEITAVNNAMKTYCEANEHMVYLDVTSHCYTSGITVNAEFFRDRVHPTLDNYLVYATALKKAGLDLNLNISTETTSSLTFTTDMAIKNGHQVALKENGLTLNKEFSVKGNILVSQILSNAHIAFSFDGSANNRFLLWDDDSNGTLYSGYVCDGGYQNPINSKGVIAYAKTSFELVVTLKNAYLYINNELVMVFAQANAKSLFIGTENCAVTFTDLVITSKTGNSAGYNTILSRTEIAQYENSTSTIKRVEIL